MFTITVEDAEAIVAGVKDNMVSNPSTTPERAINMKASQIVLELNDIIRDAKTISWFTGYYPKVTISEYISGLLREFKELAC